MLLRERGTLTQRELVELTQRRSATLSEQLETMEKAGYIVREKNALDKRNIDVRLTDAGRTAADEARREREATAEALFGGLSEQERTAFYNILGKLGEAWEKENTMEEGQP